MPDLTAILPDTVRVKLDQIDAQHRELTAALADPESVADHKRASSMAIRRAALDELATEYRHLRKLLADAEEMRSALAAGDPDLATLAREELPTLEHAAVDTAERIKALLVMSDDRQIG